MSDAATRIVSLRPLCRLWFERLRDDRGQLPGYLRYLLDLIDRAAGDHPRAICLPEDCMMMMQAGHAEPDDGEYARAFADAAARHGTLLVVGLVGREGGQKHNTTVLFTGDGHVVGRYHKTHLTLLEREKYGITPGRTLPVFDTQIGRVGVLTCSDILFPEAARVLALNGARIVFFPHQMAEPSEDFFQVMVRARAQDNALPIVCSTFADQPDRHWYANWIVGADGRIVTVGPAGEGFSTADLNLGAPLAMRDYIEPGDVDLRQIIFDYRRPNLYGPITDTHGSET